jgi:GxxExxY protein
MIKLGYLITNFIMQKNKIYYTDLIYKVNGAAIDVHKELGPGLLESDYHKCLKHELELEGINCLTEMKIPINYKGIQIDTEL